MELRNLEDYLLFLSFLVPRTKRGQTTCPSLDTPVLEREGCNEIRPTMATPFEVVGLPPPPCEAEASAVPNRCGTTGGESK